MLEPICISEKKYNTETEMMIGEIQLHQYGNFLDNYRNQLRTFTNTIPRYRHIKLEPIAIVTSDRENQSILSLINSDNKLLSKILLCLSSLCNEINILIKEAQNKFYHTFLLHNEGNKNSVTVKKISKLLKTMQEVSFFVKRSQAVINLLLKQVCAILGKGFSPGANLSFPEPLHSLSELLVCLVTLDCIFSENKLREHLRLYRRVLKTAVHNPKQYNATQETLRALDKILGELDMELFNGTILSKTFEVAVDENLMMTIKHCNLANEFLLFIQQIFTELEKDEGIVSYRCLLFRVNALVAFQHHIQGNIDKKLFKRLTTCNKKLPICSISGHVLWSADKFLNKYLTTMRKSAEVVSNSDKTLPNFPKDSHFLALQTVQWLIELESTISRDMSTFSTKHLQNAANLLTDGFRLLTRVTESIILAGNIHTAYNQPLRTSILMPLAHLIEVVKSAEFTFNRITVPFNYLVQLIKQHLTHKALSELENIKKNIRQEKSYKDQQLDVLSTLSIVKHTLKGPNVHNRILIAKLAISASGLSTENLQEIRTILNDLERFSDINNTFKKQFNCSFMYWNQYFLSIYLKKIIETNTDLSRLYLILGGITDCTHFDTINISKLTNEVIKTDLISPINQSIETTLRLQTHTHIQNQTGNLVESNLLQFLEKLQPAHFGQNYINVKQEIENYLSGMIYNLTTVVLHDWRTYGEMRRLANTQYGLNTIDDNLPMHTLDQGLDILEIMRNINVFVGKYLYNLNNHVFVQEFSNNKHLNTINIYHVANSIRTHGIGIMNTAVNFTYQYLQNQFYTFSQFMFDEHIKSKLLKEIRYFSDHKAELNEMYPYTRAEKFNINIRKLGLQSMGQSYLDLFRKLITHIGNAMGYIRLIRSGGRRCLADGTCFLPDLQAVHIINELIEVENLTSLSKEAATNLKRDVNNLVNNFQDATEYFKLLVNVFAPVLRDKNNHHLRNFYMIIPPLTINFIEHSLTCKERLHKMNRDGASFTDDGFAMGLTYIITLLQQTDQLNSLNWFQSMKNKFTEDRKLIEKQTINTIKSDVKLQQTLTLTEKRIASLEKEFQLLFYGLSSARIFFQ